MRILLVIALILAPGLSFARTDCRAVEHPDYLEAVCVGDEKASPAPETPTSDIIQRGEPQQQATPEQMRASVPEVQSHTAVATPPSQASQNQVSQGTVIHRQGRQQYQKGMDEARAARLQLINELQQCQPTP